MNTPKEPIDLCAVVQERLLRLDFLKSLRVKEVPRNQCPLLYEENGDEDDEDAARYSQGAQLDASVAIFLDWWGWARPHKRYSFSVFEKTDGRWRRVHGRIEDIDVAIVSAIQTLTTRALHVTGADE